jgi:hypothetical protein
MSGFEAAPRFVRTLPAKGVRRTLNDDQFCLWSTIDSGFGLAVLSAGSDML